MIEVNNTGVNMGCSRESYCDKPGKLLLRWWCDDHIQVLCRMTFYYVFWLVCFCLSFKMSPDRSGPLALASD